MPSHTTTASVDDPRVSLDFNGILPPDPKGGDGDRFSSPDETTRLRRARLGLLVALTPVLMLFVSFTSAYLVRQGLPTFDSRTNTMIHDWIPVTLPRLLLINTCVLVLSSASMELTRRQIRAQAAAAQASSISGVRSEDAAKVPWLSITLLLGLGFLFGQWMAWRELAASGFYVASTPSSSFVYLLTGTHAVHLMGGVLALLFAGIATALRRSAGTRRIVLDLTAWYWHFMALLWIYILCLLEFVS